jgi:hypothetical protein
VLVHAAVVKDAEDGNLRSALRRVLGRLLDAQTELVRARHRCNEEERAEKKTSLQNATLCG